MKIYTAIIFIFCFCHASAAASSCSIVMSSKIITGFSSGTTHSYIKKSNCEAGVISALNNFVMSNTGTFKTQSLSRNIATLAGITNITITPDIIKISKIADELRPNLQLDKTTTLTLISNSENLISIGVDSISFDSVENNNLGHIRMNIDNNKSSWVRFQIQNKQLVVIAIKSITAGEQLVNNHNVSTREEYAINDKTSLTRLDPYMVATKNINNGEVIRHEHYRKDTLVNAHAPVNVVLKTGEIKITTSGVSLGSGQFGQMIQVRLENTKKIVNANIVAPNKVMVEL